MRAGSVTLCLVALAPMLVGCADPSVRYAGTVTTEQGACGPGFDADGRSPATLMVQGGNVQFAPNDGVLVLNGHITSTGHVVASVDAPGADRKPFPQVFEGDRAEDRVTGRFATPRCRATVALARP